jgi:hypothetical protein
MAEFAPPPNVISQVTLMITVKSIIYLKIAVGHVKRLRLKKKDATIFNCVVLLIVREVFFIGYLENELTVIIFLCNIK